MHANMLKHVHPIVTGNSSVASRMCQVVLLSCGNRRVSCARARVYSSVLHPGEHQKLPVRACPNLNTSFPERFGVAMPRISAVIALCPFGRKGRNVFDWKVSGLKPRTSQSLVLKASATWRRTVIWIGGIRTLPTTLIRHWQFRYKWGQWRNKIQSV
jgi:hypothetical protein